MTGIGFIVFMLVLIDQLFKLWAFNVTAEGTFAIIPGLFYINYVENTGAAFNMFAGSRWPLVIVTSILLAVIAYLLFGRKVTDEWSVSALSLILAGGIGNLIDRATKGFVVDCLDFSALFGFPVFNIADCCVVLGVGMLIYYCLIVEPRNKKLGIAPKQFNPTKKDEQ